MHNYAAGAAGAAGAGGAAGRRRGGGGGLPCGLTRPLIYLSPGFLLQFGENRGSEKHTSRYPIKLKFSTDVNND